MDKTMNRREISPGQFSEESFQNELHSLQDAREDANPSSMVKVISLDGSTKMVSRFYLEMVKKITMMIHDPNEDLFDVNPFLGWDEGHLKRLLIALGEMEEEPVDSSAQQAKHAEAAEQLVNISKKADAKDQQDKDRGALMLELKKLDRELRNENNHFESASLEKELAAWQDSVASTTQELNKLKFLGIPPLFSLVARTSYAKLQDQLRHELDTVASLNKRIAESPKEEREAAAHADRERRAAKKVAIKKRIEELEQLLADQKK